MSAINYRTTKGKRDSGGRVVDTTMAVSTLGAATSSRASAEPLDQGLYVTPHRICSAVTKPLPHGPHHRLKVEVWVGKVEVTEDEPGGLV